VFTQLVPDRIRLALFGVGWFRKNKAQGPVRQEAVHQPSTQPLYLDGGASWKAYTAPDDAYQLGRLPVD
jgi:hypothetical protein